MSEKKVVSMEVFEKEVEKEYAFLTWLEYMDPKEAQVEARRRVSAEMVPETMRKK